MGIAPRAERRGPLPSWRRAGVGSSPIRASPADRRGRPPGGLGRRGNSDEPRSGLARMATGRRARRAGTGGWGRGCRRRVAAWGSLGRCWPRGALWRRGRRHGHDPRGPLSGTPAVGLAVRALHSRYAATPRGDLREGKTAQYAVLIYAPDSVHAVDAPTEDTAECDDHADGLRAQGVMTFAFALTPSAASGPRLPRRGSPSGRSWTVIRW